MNTAIALILSYVLLLTPPASTDSKPFVISGVVIERSEQPAAGADIWLVEAITADQDRRFGLEVIWSSRAKPSEGTIPVLVHGPRRRRGSIQPRAAAGSCRAAHAPTGVVIWAATTGRHPRLASRLLPRIGLAAEPPVRLRAGPAARYRDHRAGSCSKPTRPGQDRSKPARATFPFRNRWASPFRPQPMPRGMPLFPALCQTRFVLMHQALEPRRSRSRVPGCPMPELQIPKSKGTPIGPSQ